ncbi:polysaccharide biosynthesis tyrosine autokinase [Subtercola sp. RTI3]|nr:polysaccharide biosynthesis tyrosine autokinase [Subtercola sp. RTI3]
MSLQEYIRVLQAHWVTVVAITLLGAAAAFGWTFAQTRVYTANSSGIVTLMSDGSIGDTVASDALAKSKATTYVAVGESRAVAQLVITALGLTASPETVAAEITVTNIKDTPTINVTARASSGIEAKKLADAWIVGLTTQIATLENKAVTQQAGSTVVAAVTFLEPVESAVAPTQPIFPNVRLSVIIGALIGLVLAIVYAMVRNVLDRRIRTAATIQQQFKLAVIGVLPKDAALTDENRIVSETGGIHAGSVTVQSRPLAEAFRELRTNMRFMRVDSPPRIIVISSPSPNDGKSTVTANLAVALSAAGQKVVVVDGDLRKPMVASTFNVVGGVGVTDLLIGSAELDDVLQPWGERGNLRVLGAGSIPPNPSELLGSHGMTTLLRELALDAIVLVDAPPLLPVTDAAILAAISDGAIIVVSAGRTTTDELERALAGISMGGGRTLGVVLNRVPTKGAGGRGYGYYHGSYSEDAPVVGALIANGRLTPTIPVTAAESADSTARAESTELKDPTAAL